MPLHSQAVPIFTGGFVGFDNPVRAGCADSERSSKFIDGHVVMTVHSDFTRTEYVVQVGARNDFKNVTQILLNFVTMMDGPWALLWDILKQRATAQDIDQLHA